MVKTPNRIARNQAHERIQELENLEPGWLEGTGGPASPRAAGTARKLVTLLGDHIARFYLFPTNDNGINFEDPALEGDVSVEITIEKNGDINLFAMRHGLDQTVYIEGVTPPAAARFAAAPLDVASLGEQLFKVEHSPAGVTVTNTRGPAAETVPADEALREWAAHMHGAHVTRQATHPDLRETVARLTTQPNSRDRTDPVGDDQQF